MSELKLLQEKTARTVNLLGHNRDPKIILLFILEELGEVTRAFLKEKGHKNDNDRVTESFRQEMGDLFFLLLALSSSTNVDLEKELGKTIDKMYKRKSST